MSEPCNFLYTIKNKISTWIFIKLMYVSFFALNTNDFPLFNNTNDRYERHQVFRVVL